MITARLYLLHGWRDRARPWMIAPAGIVIVGLLWAFNAVGGWPVQANWKLLWPDVEGLGWAALVLTYLCAGATLPRWIARPVTFVGKISYSLYVVHFVVLMLCLNNTLFLRFTGHGYDDALITTALVVLPIALASAALLFDTIERPFMALRPRYVVDRALVQ